MALKSGKHRETSGKWASSVSISLPDPSIMKALVSLRKKGLLSCHATQLLVEGTDVGRKPRQNQRRMISAYTVRGTSNTQATDPECV